MSIERRTTKSGQVRYDVRMRRPDGSPIKKTFRTKREAQRFEAKQIADREQGTWIDPHAGRVVFSEWSEEWYATMIHTWRPATAARHRVALDRHWLPGLGSIRMSSITPRQIQRIINGMASDLRPATIRSYYGTVRSLFGDAVDTDVIGRSPCRGIKLPAARSAERRVLTPDELHRLADAVGVDWRCFIYLAGVLGLRFGEAAALRVSDVDLRHRQLSIVRTVTEVRGKVEIGPPKTARSTRSVPMPDVLATELATHIGRLGLETRDLLFSNEIGGPIGRSNFRTRIWNPAVRDSRLDGLTFHGLRHSAATPWIAEGVDARTVQQLLGHTDPRLVLRLYAHATDRGMASAADRVGSMFWPDGRTDL